jgi:hypothetical protein
MLWQVPVGNYYYATCNNTDGHYEDNRAQYFLEGYPTNPHLQQWANAGVIGILFGRGAGGPTTYSDDKGDGVSNPAPYVRSGTRKSPTNLGHTSQNSDDDGGYLRLKVRAYFAAGALTLPGAAPSPSPGPSPDFTLTLSPATLTVLRGRAGAFTVNVNGQNGFSSAVTLSRSVSPALKGTLTVTSTSLSAPGTTPLSVSVGRRATPGTYTVTVTGVGGGLTRSATATLIVQ